jgi:hypothetical protein
VVSQDGAQVPVSPKLQSGGGTSEPGLEGAEDCEVPVGSRSPSFPEARLTSQFLGFLEGHKDRFCEDPENSHIPASREASTEKAWGWLAVVFGSCAFVCVCVCVLRVV